MEKMVGEVRKEMEYGKSGRASEQTSQREIENLVKSVFSWPKGQGSKVLLVARFQGVEVVGRCRCRSSYAAVDVDGGNGGSDGRNITNNQAFIARWRIHSFDGNG